MFERFTDGARSVLVLAQEEARLLGHNHIGTEHIFLGLILEENGVAAAALTSFGVTLDGVRTEVAEILGTAAASGGSPPFTTRAKKVLELSLREALHLGHNYIGTEHILLGILREGEGVAAQVLIRLGVDLGSARQRVTALISGEAPAEATVGVATDFVRVPSADVGRTSREPRCPQCRADLTDGTRFRTLSVPPDAEEGQNDPLSIFVVYCRRCGVVIHTFPSPPAHSSGVEAPAALHLGGSGVLAMGGDGSEEPEAGRNEVPVRLQDERRHATDVEGVEKRTPD